MQVYVLHNIQNSRYLKSLQLYLTCTYNSSFLSNFFPDSILGYLRLLLIAFLSPLDIIMCLQFWNAHIYSDTNILHYYHTFPNANTTNCLSVRTISVNSLSVHNLVKLTITKHFTISIKFLSVFVQTWSSSLRGDTVLRPLSYDNSLSRFR